MPLYTLYCTKCNKEFDVFLSLSDLIAGAPCPNCGEISPDRVASDSRPTSDATCGISGRKT